MAIYNQGKLIAGAYTLVKEEGATTTGGTVKVPIGTILPFAGNYRELDGFLRCDGSLYLKTDYPQLYTVIGDLYRQDGDDSDYFRVPNLSDGRYLQGNTTAGTSISAGLPNITGNLGNRVRCLSANNSATGVFSNSNTSTQGYGGGSYVPDTTIDFKASNSNPIYGGSTTVTPESMTVIYYIKAKQTNSDYEDEAELDWNTEVLSTLTWDTTNLSTSLYTATRNEIAYVNIDVDADSNDYNNDNVSVFVITDQRTEPVCIYKSPELGGDTHNKIHSAIVLNKGDRLYAKSTSVTNIAGWQASVTSFEFHGIGGSSSSVTSYGCGGVIDGTLLIDKQTVEWTQTTTAKSFVYETKNDCGLFIYQYTNIQGAGPGAMTFYIGDDDKPIYSHDEGPHEPETWGSIIPLKKGTKIYAQAQTNEGSIVGFYVYEYKLNSLAPQIAMTDWDGGVYQSYTTSFSNYEVPYNSVMYIRIQRQSTGDGNAWIVINGESYFIYANNYSYDSNNFMLSKGDTITVTCSGAVLSVVFYKLKTVAQPDCASYVIETGKFYSGSGEYDETNNDSWYRLYSDGWCEQGGTTATSSGYYTVSLKNNYSSTSYQVVSTGGTASNWTINITDKTVSSFKIINLNSASSGATGPVDWEAKGFVS